MKLEDFQDIKVGQELFWHRERTKVMAVGVEPTFGPDAYSWYVILDFGHIQRTVVWKLGHDVVHLVPPDTAKRYWRWKIDGVCGWEKHNRYMDDFGNCTDGHHPWGQNVWRTLPGKIKIEDDFVEV